MTTVRKLQPSAVNYSRAPGITAAPGGVLKLADAAAELGLPESTLQFWISRRGCPTVRRGGRGRGNATLIDPAAVRHWMAGRDQPTAPTAPTTEHDVVMAYAQRLPDLLAQAMFAAWCAVESPAKRQLAASLACAWYETASAELDRLRERHPDIPHVTSLPESIVKLKSIV